MAGRKHLLVEDSAGKVRKVKLDPQHVKKQIAEYKSQGLKAYVVDDDELIKFGLMLKKIK